MEFKHLLAKSCDDPDNPPEAATLVGHTSQVIEGAQVINAILREHVSQFLPSDATLEMWDDAVYCAAWLHDIGKANDHFQLTLRNKSFRQGFRHESLSIIIIDKVLDSWLTGFWQQYPDWFKPALLFSLAGHHLKFPDTKKRSGVIRQEVIFLGNHPQIQSLLTIGKDLLSLPEPPSFPKHVFSLRPFDENELKDVLSKIIRRYTFDFSEKQKKFISILKSTLMCADLAGSALPGKKLSIAGWLKPRLQTIFSGDELAAVVAGKLSGKTLQPFQKQVAEAKEITVLVEAGCGAGKTVAAYQWAAQHARGKKLFFCYPTTATASEGFSNYLQEPDFETLLVHSRMAIDYRLLANMPPRSPAQRELSYLGLEAIETWPAAAVVCTAHTVLGILQNTRRGLYAWPSLIRGVFVFDEIHAFSELLFAHLLRFLQFFQNTPVLLMTATLSSARKKALKEICVERGGIAVLKGPIKRETAKRYSLTRSTEEDAWDQCANAISEGGKVLWICNTISRAIDVAKRANEMNYPVEPYHSRYRYKDRLVRQRTVIDGFLPDKPAMLAVTTQVAEMSLDLSADLLITEYAPMPALIQRLGRLNRFEEVPQHTAPALFLRPENALPYEKKENEDSYWERIEAWLDRVADNTGKSQKDLFEAFLAVDLSSAESFELPFSDWVDTPWRSETSKHALMEPGYTVEMVREEDLANGHLAELAIPMPIPHGKNWNWPTKGKYVIAPKGLIEYDPFWGGKYAKPDEFEII
ncbi:MAG: CRISPR-associated helicase Cas3' [Proteobacteria bacterium]|nr:CRISPR-associated helicase Cas3' [Pseudomonadota bacterium]MBU4295160.1 CRISPR-associated helicase Cas3' [Pseudomonadota bacterium]MCG2749058.1 CRISPR-associated helicase Cas3' [Desulfobulbaceae bacterium]